MSTSHRRMFSPFRAAPQRRSALPLLLAPLALGACAFGGPDPQPATPPSPVAAFMARADKGEAETLDDADFGRGVRVRVDERFTSAKGEECKRGTVLSAQGEAEVVVICRKADGAWAMAPRVWGQGIER